MIAALIIQDNIKPKPCQFDGTGVLSVRNMELQLNSLPGEGCGWMCAKAGRGLYV